MSQENIKQENLEEEEEMSEEIAKRKTQLQDSKDSNANKDVVAQQEEEEEDDDEDLQFNIDEFDSVPQDSVQLNQQARVTSNDSFVTPQSNSPKYTTTAAATTSRSSNSRKNSRSSNSNNRRHSSSTRSVSPQKSSTRTPRNEKTTKKQSSSTTTGSNNSTGQSSKTQQQQYSNTSTHQAIVQPLSVALDQYQLAVGAMGTLRLSSHMLPSQRFKFNDLFAPSANNNTNNNNNNTSTIENTVKPPKLPNKTPVKRPISSTPQVRKRQRTSTLKLSEEIASLGVTTLNAITHAAIADDSRKATKTGRRVRKPSRYREMLDPQRLLKEQQEIAIELMKSEQSTEQPASNNNTTTTTKNFLQPAVPPTTVQQYPTHPSTCVFECICGVKIYEHEKSKKSNHCQNCREYKYAKRCWASNLPREETLWEFIDRVHNDLKTIQSKLGHSTSKNVSSNQLVKQKTPIDNNNNNNNNNTDDNNVSMTPFETLVTSSIALRPVDDAAAPESPPHTVAAASTQNFLQPDHSQLVKDNWIQCNDCLQWRRVFSYAMKTVDKMFKDKPWCCTDNFWDLKHSRCSDPEEPQIGFTLRPVTN